jgi:hypothetical protein
MRIIAHTKYGVFNGVGEEYSEEKYEEIGKFLEKLADLSYFSFVIETGEVYMTKEMIVDSLFVLEK